MNNILKIFLFLLLGILLCLALVLFANAIYFKDKGGVVEQANLSGGVDSEFIAETISTSDQLSFVFTPRADTTNDYYLTYVLSEDGSVIASFENELVKDVSRNNPIKINTSRDNDLSYSLETVIRDNSQEANVLHEDKIEIHPQKIKQDQATLDLVESYIKENINELSPEKAVLGGSFYVTDLKFEQGNKVIVEYEDGHIALQADLEYEAFANRVEVTSFRIRD